MGDASGFGADADVWVYSMDTGGLSRLTFEGDVYPLWTPDGSGITYLRVNDHALLTKSADGSGSEEQLTPGGADPSLAPWLWATPPRPYSSLRYIFPTSTFWSASPR